jgi:capsular exopolysaccharide synthesis family protein
MSDGQHANHPAGFRLEDVVGLCRRRRWTVLGTAVLVFAGAFAWVGTRTPVYRASATVLIDQDSGQNGILSELAALGKAPAAASEIALISSRSIAERAVERPETGGVPRPGLPGFERHLGLTTRVDDERFRPLATLWGRLFGATWSDGELFAWVEAAEPGAPEAVRVSFPYDGVVRVSLPTTVPGIHVGDEAETFEHTPGAPVVYRGLRLFLDTEGDLLGRSFIVHHTSRDDAVRRLRGSTRAIERERNSGVVQVTVSDSDPVRAARTADALCLNYFDLNVDRGTKRASQTVTFIDEQLAEQIRALEQAEAEVVELREANPETIDVTTAAEVLINRLSELEVERVHMSLTHSALDEAIRLLDEGDFDALSRLGAEISDEVSKGYIVQITELTAQFEMQDRSDVGSYKLLLQTKLETMRTEADELGVQAQAIRSVIDAYRAGDEGAVAGLSGRQSEGFGAGPLVGGYLERIAALRAEASELEQVYTADYRPLADRLASVESLRGRVLEQLEGRFDALQKLRTDRARLVAKTRTILEEHPGEERERIAQALANLRARTLEHLRNRFDGVAATRSALEEQINVIEARLGELPEKERRLAGPLRRLATHAEIVQFLLTSKQDAEIARAATVATADFIDPAEPPILRYAPRVGFTLVMGAFVGILIGLGVAYLRESFKGSIHTEADLEAASGLAVLGAIPDFTRGRLHALRSGERFLALRDAPEGPVAEAYRSLRANLRFALGGDREIHTLAVTSCTPGEGKSITNADLAIAFANGNKRVLLVDADMRKPTVHKSFHVERTPGLAEVLLEDLDWRECLQPSGIEGLDLLPAGHHRGKPGDLLARPDIGDLVDALAAEYDVVVFDLPPALVVADVESFAHKLDAMLLLYRADGVSRDAVRAAASRLRHTGSNLVGAVLNAVRAEHGKGGGYYHTYYEYGAESKKRLKKGA